MRRSDIAKIAFLLPCLKFGGAERAALNLAAAFKARGIAIDLLLMSREGEFVEEAEREFTVMDLRCDRTYKLPGRLAAYLRQHTPDALISSFWKLNLCACLARLLNPRVRLLLWEHSLPSKSANSPTWLYSISASIFYRFSTAIVAVSGGVQRDVQGITLGLERRLVVIFNPITPPAPGHLRSHSPAETPRRLVWVGRLNDPKNPELALAAFALLDGFADATMVVVGDGKLAGLLVEQSRSLGLGGRVKFVGYLPDPYVEIGAADLLLLTSDHEGLGNVIIEAMYCGLRVVSTDCGEGVHEILRNGDYGSIVPLRDPAALAGAIASRLSGPHDPQRQMAGAQRFQPAFIAQQFLALLHGEPLEGADQ